MPYAPWVKKPSHSSAPAAPSTVTPEQYHEDKMVTPAVIEATAALEDSWSATSRKAILVDAAESRGIATDGLTKAELVDLLRST